MVAGSLTTFSDYLRRNSKGTSWLHSEKSGRCTRTCSPVGAQRAETLVYQSTEQEANEKLVVRMEQRAASCGGGTGRRQKSVGAEGQWGGVTQSAVPTQSVFLKSNHRKQQSVKVEGPFPRGGALGSVQGGVENVL